MIQFITLTVVLMGIYLLLALLLRAFNQSKPYRFLQMRYVIASLAYSVVMSVLFIYILGGVDAIMSHPTIELIVLTGVPSTSYSAAFMLLIVLLANDIFMAGAVVLAAVCRLITPARAEYPDSAIDSKLEGIADRYYEIEERTGWPYLRAEHIMTARWMNASRYAILVLYIVWMAFACFKLYNNKLFNAQGLLLALKFFMIVVSAAYVPLTQMYFFLDGVTRQDNILEFDVTEIGFVRKGNYGKLIPYFKRKYGDMIANSDNCLIRKAHIEDYMINDVGNQMLKRSSNDRALASIINSVKYNCDRLSETYKEAVLCLTEGDSIICNDSIYGEILLYIAGYINYKLASGCKVLIVTSYKARVSRIRDELNDRLSRINDIDPVWRIETTDENWEDATDILVCAADKLDSIGTRDFAGHIGCVIVDDPSGSTVSTEVAQRMSYMKITGATRYSKLQYIFLNNEDNRNLEESLEHIIGQDLKPFRNITARSDFYCFVWKNESFSQPQTRIGIRPYIGNASLISLEAAKAGVKNIGVWVDGSVPYVTYRDMMMQNIDEIQQRFLNKSSINMNDIITYNASENYRKGLSERAILTDTEDNNLKFIIEYDVDNNLLAVAKSWSNYALDENTLITIISDPYMLRGYLAENLGSLIHSPSLIKQIIPSKGEDVHRSNELLMLRLHKGMRSDHLIDAYNSFNGTSLGHDQIEECLSALLEDTCPPTMNIGVYNSFTFTKETYFANENSESAFVNAYYVKLTNAGIYDHVRSRRRCATIRFGAADESRVLPIDADDIYLYYLPNQIHCFDGELAVVKEITNSGELLIERTTPQDVRSYAQIADYSAVNCSEETRMIDHAGKYTLGSVTFDLSWDISGYYNFKKGSTLYAEDESGVRRPTFTETKLPAPVRVTRNSKEAVVVRLCRRCENKEKTELTLALMINELFKTLLPENYHEISAMAVRTPAMDELLNGISGEERPVADIIPLVSIDGHVPSEFPEIVLAERTDSDKGLLSECIDEVNFQNILDIMYMYLKWETEAQSPDNRFLLFGFDNYPSMLDIESTLAYLDEVRTLNNAEVADIMSLNEDLSDVCPYCGRHLGVEYVETSDGRLMCVDCRNQVVQTRKEITDIYKDASNKLIHEYGLGEKPWNVKKIAFKSRKDIIHETGSDNLLGYYDTGRRELWVLKGLPRAFEFSTLVHELVRAWEHENLPASALANHDLYAGHSMWVEIEMCRKENQNDYADYLEYCLEHDLLVAYSDTGNGGSEYKSYTPGYMEMKRRMSVKKDNENAFDIARQWASEL
ncbi:MAG: hypothetical protein E7230_04695 [Clostridiales bacterium]|nr:hypothetical protein [Clostridiales bacterium]